ncbi:hypothetical protein DXG03_008169 [Asterophora parasitica]|uniref:Uncharacterized protein n=1 Tax=Asterophora parasitica TaxID=117018 RepID=A0A9P7G492_9AGAR|nr:hypothetical protein DXG03_008169 [Asterophora parasitica]
MGTLDIDNQIGILKRELLNLRRHREAFDSIKIWSKPPKGTFRSDPPKRDMPPHMSDASGPATPSTAASPDPMTSTSGPTAVEKVPLPPQSAPQPVPLHPCSPPIHLFSNIPDNRYVLPSTHNLATTDWCANPAYHTEAPITDAAKSTKLFDHCLESMLMVSVGKLCSVAPTIQGKLHEAITPKQVMTTVLRSIVKVPDNHYTSCIEELDTLPMAEDAHSNSTPLPGALITTNVIDTYYQHLQPGESTERIIVAKESHSLWSILMYIDAREQVECIVDSGCQIITMLEEVCHNLHIRYDPTVILHMQSANRTVDPSLGLARNVPCTISNITLYLQINPAYDILLGSTTPSVNPDPYPIPAQSPTTSHYLSPYAPAVPSSLHESFIPCSWLPDLPSTLIATATSTLPLLSPAPSKSAPGIPAICKVKGVQSKKKYKPVAQKVRLVITSCPDHFRIERKILGDPLANMPILDPNPPPFHPTG